MPQKQNVKTEIVAENFIQRIKFATMFFGFIPQMLIIGRVGMVWHNIFFEPVNKQREKEHDSSDNSCCGNH